MLWDATSRGLCATVDESDHHAVSLSLHPSGLRTSSVSLTLRTYVVSLGLRCAAMSSAASPHHNHLAHLPFLRHRPPPLFPLSLPHPIFATPPPSSPPSFPLSTSDWPPGLDSPAGCCISRDYARRGWATETDPNWGPRDPGSPGSH